MKRGISLREFLILLTALGVLFFIFYVQTNSEPMVKVMDGCEYLVTYGGDFDAHYAHKGNCTNPIHKGKGE